MRVAIRVDASVQIGTGHVMRCLALGDALAARGVDVQFISVSSPGNMESIVRARGFGILQIETNDGLETIDAQWTGALLARQDFDWLVVDHYSLGKTWEQAISPVVRKILVIDDLRRTHHCDMLLDQGFTIDGALAYKGKVPKTTEVLLGPEFALLAADVRMHARRQPDTVRRVLVYFGGSDPDNLTELAVEAFSQPGLDDLELDIVMGLNSAHGASVEELASYRGRANIHRFHSSLAALMARCELAVGAGGVTALERLAVGLPALVVSVADNQVGGCQALARAGFIEYLGPKGSISTALLTDRAIALRTDIRRLGLMSAGGKKLVDGKGAEKVAERMLA